MEGKYLYRDNDIYYRKTWAYYFYSKYMELRYKDVKKVGKMYLLKKDDFIFKKSPLYELGLEPWDNKLNENYLKERFKNKKKFYKNNFIRSNNNYRNR